MNTISNDTISTHQVTAVSTVGESNGTLIANGMNALWLLFADNSSPCWKSSDPNLNGFGLGNPSLPAALQSNLITFFQQQIGTTSSLTPLMQALSQSGDIYEKELSQGLNFYRINGTVSFSTDLQTAVSYYQTHQKNDTSTPMGKILEVLEWHTPESRYPATYVPNTDDPTVNNTANFKDILSDTSTIDPSNIGNTLKYYGEIICGSGDGIAKTSLWWLTGGNTPTGDNATDPLEMLIHSVIGTKLPDGTSLATYAWLIHADGTLPDPTKNPDFFQAFQPGGLGALLPILGYFGNWALGK